MFRQETHQEMR